MPAHAKNITFYLGVSSTAPKLFAREKKKSSPVYAMLNLAFQHVQMNGNGDRLHSVQKLRPQS